MFALDVCPLPSTGGTTGLILVGLSMLVGGVIAARWMRSSAGRLSVTMVPLALLGGLFLVPSAADSCLNLATDAPSLAVVEGLPAASTPLLSNAAVAAGGAMTVTIGGFIPNEMVQLIVGSTPQVIGFAAADGQGFATLTGSLPQGLTAGNYTLVVYAPVSGIGFVQEITVESLNNSTTLAPTTMVPTTSSTTLAPTTTTSTTPTTTATTTTTTTTTTVAPVVYSVGDPGPSGGKIFYKDLTRATGSQYFEVACANWQNNCAGTNSSDPQVDWDSALAAANNLVLGGNDDWFMPSIDELNELCKYARDTHQAAGATTICQGGTLRSGFNTDYYWTTFEYGLNGANLQLFDTGAQAGGCKCNPASIRPIRVF